MRIDLTTEEAHELKTVLDASLERLFNELAHTDHREFRVELRGRIERLQELDRRLEAVLETPSLYA
jgi:hypothetical protein